MSFNIAKCKVMHERDIRRSHGLKKPEANFTVRESCRQIRIRYAETFNSEIDTPSKTLQAICPPAPRVCGTGWSPWLVGNIEKIERVQEKAVKMVAGLKAREYKERYTELGPETMEESRQKQDMVLVHRFMCEEPNMNMLQRTRKNNEGARTRQASTAHGLATQYARTDIRTYSFAVRVVGSWNQLPEAARTAQGKEAFKRSLRQTKH
jgi:ribonuclease P/MRP protein subunit RPP40